MHGNISIGASVLAAFLAAFVEFVEALTVVLAVGTVRGWRSAIAGSGLACGVLLALVALLGNSLTRIPLYLIQLGVGALIVLFGLRWLRKAILRYIGVIPLHDESAAYAKTAASLKTGRSHRPHWDKGAIATAFNITILEGTEVIFIIIAIGAGGHKLLLAAASAAVAALASVVVLGILLHKPLSQVPENSLKFFVGVLLSSFGTFWFGEGMRLSWPGGDLAILLLVVAYLGVALGILLTSKQLLASPKKRTAHE